MTSPSTWVKWPTIKKAALLISYDNGIINRESSQESFLEICESILYADGVYEDEVSQFEEFLKSLSEQDLEILCSGEFTDVETISKNCPKNSEGYSLSGLLEDFFDV